MTEQIGTTYLLEKRNNTVGRGTIGLTKAISYFASRHYIVAVPLSDNQPYDLLVDNGEKIYKVEVKTSTCIKPNGVHYVTLKRTRHNKKVNRMYPISSIDCDLVFIFTSSGDMFLIPTTVVDNMHGVCLGKKYSQYKTNEEVLSIGELTSLEKKRQ